MKRFYLQRLAGVKFVVFACLALPAQVALAQGGPPGTEGPPPGGPPPGDFPGGPPGAPPGGGPGGGAPGGTLSDLATWGEHAGIFIDNGKLVVDGSEGAVTVSDGGALTATAISGVRVDFDDIGDWSRSLHGQSGIVIQNDEGDAASDQIHIGGKTDYYQVDGEGYNSIIRLGARDGDEPNTHGQGNRNPTSHNDETMAGLGIVYDARQVTLENILVETDGRGRSALMLRGDSDSLVLDSTFISRGGHGEIFTAPMFIALTASARSNLILSKGNSYFFDTKMISTDWGNYSLDGVNGAHVYLVNSYGETHFGGYGMLGLGLGTPGNENWVYGYGVRTVSPQYGMMILTAGYVTYDSLGNIPDEVNARQGDYRLGKPLNDSGRSYIGGGIVAVSVNSDMNAKPTLVGELRAHDTTFTTANVTDLAGKPIVDNLTLLADRYKNDPVKGGTPYIYMKYARGSTIWVRSSNIEIDFDRVDLESASGVLFRTSLDVTNPVTYVKDGVEAVGSHIHLANMELEGDIVHDDYQRGMDIELSNTRLRGSVSAATVTGWNRMITGFVDANLDPDSPMDRDLILAEMAPHSEYSANWGVDLTIDAGSDWMVTGESNLASLTIEPGASIGAPDGFDLDIRTGCRMDGALEKYDCSAAGSLARPAPGTYQGVVIRLTQ